MSTTLAFRLILGLVVGGVLTCSVWDRNDRELKEQPADEDTRTGMPRFRSFAAAETLPTMLVMYLAISLAIGGREMAVQYLLGLLLRVFLLIGVYYVLLLAVMPLLRRHISARVCAVLWLLPGYLYFLAQVSSVQRADPGGERMLVLHASGTLVTVLLAVWAAGAIGVFAWKIISHLRFRRRVLKDAVPVTDEETQVQTFDNLADDYICKPFSLILLLKRIEALLRARYKTENTWKYKDAVVDFSGYRATYLGKDAAVTPKEIKLLAVLLENAGQVVSRDQILDRIWGEEESPFDRVVDVYVKNLRKKLQLDCIITVKGVGYRLELP